MASVLLPTEQLIVGNRQGGGGVQNRIHFFKADPSIAVSQKPSERLAGKALDMIQEYTAQVLKSKEDALVTRAENEYSLQLNELQNNYTALRGQNAVDGYNEFQQNLVFLNKKYGKVFDNSRMQQDLQKKMDNLTLNTKVNAQNWHNKQVFNMQLSELEASADLAAQNFVANLGSPMDARNHQMIEDTFTKYINMLGITDPNSAAYQVERHEFYDKALKSSLVSQIHINPQAALANLSRVKGDLSQDVYAQLMVVCKDRIETQAIRQQQKAAAAELKHAALEQRQAAASMKAISQSFKPWTLEEKLARREQFASEYKNQVMHYDKSKSEEQLIRDAYRYADKQIAERELAIKELKAQNADTLRVIRNELAYQSDEGISFDANNPLGNFSQDAAQIVIAEFGSKENAENSIRQEYDRVQNLATKANEDYFNSLPDGEKLRLLSDPVQLDNFLCEHPVSTVFQHSLVEVKRSLQQKSQQGTLKEQSLLDDSSKKIFTTISDKLKPSDYNKSEYTEEHLFANRYAKMAYKSYLDSARDNKGNLDPSKISKEGFLNYLEIYKGSTESQLAYKTFEDKQSTIQAVVDNFNSDGQFLGISFNLGSKLNFVDSLSEDECTSIIAQIANKFFDEHGRYPTEKELTNTVIMTNSQMSLKFLTGDKYQKRKKKEQEDSERDMRYINGY